MSTNSPWSGRANVAPRDQGFFARGAQEVAAGQASSAAGHHLILRATALLDRMRLGVRANPSEGMQRGNAVLGQFVQTAGTQLGLKVNLQVVNAPAVPAEGPNASPVGLKKP